jgi:dTDP-4-amino-4,6-dideoxygalactose transaminase
MKSKNISLFYPNVTGEMKRAVLNALGERTITQGKTVDEFENRFAKSLKIKNVLGLNCCTSALELAYHLLNLKPKDEIIVPVFTCTADTVLLKRLGVKIVFADVKENMLLDWDDAAKKITKKTKAIVNVHLFGQLNETRNIGVPVIGDAAQYLGKTHGERFTAHSFQATKIMTTVDGGVLICKKKDDYRRARLLRWYGIDRDTEKNNIDVDIFEPGYKNHMNNVTAAMGLAALSDLTKFKKKITQIQKGYRDRLKGIPEIKTIGGSPFLIHADKRDKLIMALAEKGIEVGLGHRRNDIYSVFGGKKLNLPNMNRLENTYLLLPCRANMDLKAVSYITKQIRRFYEKS